MNKVATSMLMFLITTPMGLGAEGLPAHSDDLSKALKRIDMERNGRSTDTLKLENDCLALLNKDSSPEDKGKVYRQIALIYALSGLTKPDKCIEYSKLAMAHPLEVPSKVRLCISLASALEVKSWKARGDEFVSARADIALACFQGLKEISDRKIPAERQKLPVVEMFDSVGPPGSPEIQELIRACDEINVASHLLGLGRMV